MVKLSVRGCLFNTYRRSLQPQCFVTQFSAIGRFSEQDFVLCLSNMKKQRIRFKSKKKKGW